MRILDTQPLFININEIGNKISQSWDWLKNKGQEFKSIANPPESYNQMPFTEKMRGLSTDIQQNVFEPLKRAEEKVGQYQVPFLPESSPLRYLPGKLGEETGKGLLPQNIAEAGMFAVPLGTLGKVASKLPVGKQVAKVATKELGEVAPRIFKGFTDLTTKVLNKLVGKTTVSKQFISDLTNAPELKQVERDLIRNVLDSYGKEITPRYIESDYLTKKFASSQLLDNKGKITPSGAKVDSWLMDWYIPKEILGRKAPMPDAEIEGILNRYRPNQPVKLYRAVSTEIKGNQTGLESWSYVPTVGEFFGRGQRKTISRTFLPDEIFFDTTKVPDSFIERFDNSALTNMNGVGEVIVYQDKYPLNQIIKTDQIPVQEFANKVKQELLPLKLRTSKEAQVYDSVIGRRRIGERTRYENISLPNGLRGNVADYSEHIWESPIKTSAAETHFSGDTQNYFGHTRIEDMADTGLRTLKGEPIGGSMIGGKPGGTRRVIEVQSDLYQKGALEEELAKIPKLERGSMGAKLEKMPNETTDDFLKRRIAYQKTLKGITTEESRLKEVAKLQQYNDPTAHFRMVREEVKQAAIDGKTKLQFPTGETAMKIEGLGETAQWIIPSEVREGGFLTAVRALKIENLKVGKVISSIGEPQDRSMKWIVTDVLGDGKFKAVPKETAEIIKKMSPESLKYQETTIADELRRASEEFDISGKVDTNNPIFKFYEKDLGSYLRNKFGAKQITDNKGVTWWELDIKPEQGKAPIEAFGALPLFVPQKDEDKQRIQFLQK